VLLLYCIPAIGSAAYDAGDEGTTQLAAPLPDPELKVSKPNPQPLSQGESGQLPAQNGTKAKSPSAILATPQEIIDAITRAIDAAADKAKTAQNPSPPDKLFLVIFSADKSD